MIEQIEQTGSQEAARGEGRQMEQDVYFKKIVVFNFWKQSLKFKTSQELFSSHDIDLGTQFLLRTLMESGYGRPQRILDAGCGYGPLGLTIKKLYPDCLAHLFDRDALAVEYTRQNAALNGVTDAEIYGSLGYDDVKRSDFDLILSNIPGKAGERVIRYLLKEAGYYLSPGGITAVVIVESLEGLAQQVLEESPGIEVLLRKKRPGHTVFHYRFNERPAEGIPRQTALERGIYLRNRMQIKTGSLELNMQTASGIPEFDTPSYRTEMLIKALQDNGDMGARRVIVFNPGQGHAATAVWKIFQPETLALVDRDLLALCYTRLNLMENGCEDERIRVYHQTGIDIKSEVSPDLIIGMLREEEGSAAVNLITEQAAGSLAGGGRMLLVTGSTAATRLIAFSGQLKRLRLRERTKWKGNSLLIFERI